MRISDWSLDVCSSDLILAAQHVNFPLPHLEIQAARLHIGIGAFLLQTLDFRIPRDTIVQPVDDGGRDSIGGLVERSEEHTSELQSLMRISYAVFCLKKHNTRH